MKNPQTWSIGITCIGSVTLAIGIAVISIPESIEYTNKAKSTNSSTPSPENNIDIGNLMEQVSADIAALRLTSPRGNNAWEKLQLVLQLDSANSAARDALHFIMSSYIHMAKSAGNEGNEQLKQQYIDQIHRVLYGGELRLGQGLPGVTKLNLARK